ncbi:MAG: fibronectin type III domain-containing protein [Clostridia bacterium]
MKGKRRIAILTALIMCIGTIFVPVSGYAATAEKKGYDNVAPTINNVTFAQSVTKPDVLKVSFDLKEEDTGAVGVSFYFHNRENLNYMYSNVGIWNNGSEGNWSKNPKFTGRYTVNVRIPSTAPEGEYFLRQIDVADQAGNQRQYFETNLGDENDIQNVNINNGRNSVTVKNEFDVAFQTYITNSTILSRLKSMPTGTCAMINFDKYNHTAKKAWFDAIRGQNKTIVFSDDGIQWMINGRDIKKKTKDVDLKVKVKRELGTSYGTKDNIVSLDFASNGILPGSMTVRVKTNYVLGTGQKLYYYDDNNLKLESTKVLGYQDGDSTWSELKLTHNSKFLLSKKDLVNSPKKLKTIRKKGRKLQVKWGKIKGVKKYQVQYSTSKKFAKKKTKTKVVKGNKVTLKRLKAKKRYYVRVRAVKSSKVYGIYSKSKRTGKIKR